MITIEFVSNTLSDSDFVKYVSLVNSLGSTPTLREWVDALCASRDDHLCLARDDATGAVVGTGRLHVRIGRNGREGWIDDVVVDEPYHHQGVGKMLMEALHARARERDVFRCTLTCRPARIDGHYLYRALGYFARETSVYSISLPL